MEGVAVLVGWYGIGLATVWAMHRAGHDPVPWAFIAWMVGACAPLIALGYVRYRQRHDGPDRSRPAAQTPTNRTAKVATARPTVHAHSRMRLT